MPVGTLAAAALVARGGDHDVDMPSGHAFNVVLGGSLLSRSAVGSRAHICYSSVSGALSGHFFTNDLAVLTSQLHARIPHCQA